MTDTQQTAAEGHNSDGARDAVLQAEALEQVKIETIRYELTLRQEESMKRVEAVGVTRKAFREEYSEFKRKRAEKSEHKAARQVTHDALNKMDQAELFAELDKAKQKALADKEVAAAARKAKVADAKKSTSHPSADAKDAAAKGLPATTH